MFLRPFPTNFLTSFDRYEPIAIEISTGQRSDIAENLRTYRFGGVRTRVRTRVRLRLQN